MADLQSFGLDVGIYGGLARPDVILELARFAESRDFGSIWVADHVAFPVTFKSAYPYAREGDFPARLDDPLMEPIATIGVLVGATRRIRIGTAVLVMPHRHPLLLARMLVTLDQFSGGRIILGAGVGWLEEEFKALGFQDFARRGKATDEAIEIFKAISAGGEVGYQGQVYSFDPVISAPGSLQRPHPPVLIGGVADPALRRVARLGDGWLAVSMGPDLLSERLQRLRQLTSEAGRKFEDLTLAFKAFINIGEPKAGRYGDREPGTGTPEQIIDDLKRLRDQGFKDIVVRSRGGTLDETRVQIDRFVNEIAAKV
ncbi:MAG: TIGR03619 family F420-dependent LLM class oxidoreductase [Hyphomicrobiaceae bacterium]